MKTITIPNVMKIKINEYENNDIEINSIEQLDSILQPLKLYEILETYDNKAKIWAYYNDYNPDKKAIMEFIKKLGLL